MSQEINKNPVIIFTHIPKTAGTSFRVHFQKHLKDQVEFIHLANKGLKWAREGGIKNFYERSIPERNETQVILGHQVNYKTKELIPQKQTKEVVFFRNPFNWEISRYNQNQNARVKRGEPALDFPAWLKSDKTHSQFDWFIANYLCLKGSVFNLPQRSKEHLLWYTLHQFDYVCFTSQVDSFAEVVCSHLNIDTHMKKENVVGIDKKDYFEKTDKNLQLLESVCQHQMELYKLIHDRFHTENLPPITE